MAQCSLDRRAEETEEQNNSRLSVMAQRGQERRAGETEGQRNSRLSDMVQHARKRRLMLLKDKITIRYKFFMQLELFFTPYLFRREERKKPKKKEIEDCQTWHNAAGREKPKKQKNKEIADCQTWHNVARREEPKKAEEQRNSRL
ncbi:hypothetical protein AVEN_162554-1 [Araneus ventricosus]|uniref:STPR domain-containing protein n=1 Tax=Araneus ventricosus TaxID=182803 RepID=A0A4Y2KSB9_ARAVE|nr:hypothetical protein AVEN_162554-1 [Araneus ventricosus]